MELLLDETLTEINENISLIQKKDGLTFGTDALLLSAFVKKVPGSVGADLGSGTGVISLLCSKRGNFKKIYACEIQKEYASLIARNAALNGVEDIIEPVLCDIREFNRPCDVAFSNPPYMKCDSGYTSRDSGRDSARRENNGDINDFCACADRILNFGGLFYVVYRPDRIADLICSLRANHLEPKKIVIVSNDENTDPSLALVEAKKGGKSGAIVRNFLLYRNGKQSAESEMLYNEGIINV